jgi:hypothetical protein
MNDAKNTPEGAHPAITAALRETFGNAPVDGWEPLRGGLSKAALFTMSVGGRRYVLRHMLGTGPGSDPSREIACMTIAAERGLAPRVHYASAEGRVCITDFVRGVTLDAWLRAGNDVVETIDRLGALIRAVHEGPSFPRFMTIAGACEALAAGLVQHGVAPSFAGELVAGVKRTRAALAAHVALAPCHYELNPGNILVDRGRMWLVDWELACQGDPFHDVATLGIFVLREGEARARLLRAYLGREPSDVERARLALSRALALTFYTFIFAQVALATRRAQVTPPVERPHPTDDPARFGEEIAREAQRELASAEHAWALAALS